MDEKLKELMENKTKCFLNGIGPGKIMEIKKDSYIVFKMTKIEEKQEESTEETIYINEKIVLVSEGEKKISTLGIVEEKKED